MDAVLVTITGHLSALVLQSSVALCWENTWRYMAKLHITHSALEHFVPVKAISHFSHSQHCMD